MNDAVLLAAAQGARARAYAPYSEFGVGAALLCADGSVATGANVENASYGLSMCAERAALFVALAAGKTTFEAVAVAGPDGATVPPCGACRQVLAEFAPRLRVIYATAQGYETATLETLLPAQFELP